ncbi:hypothetical protein BDW67DRAFT_49072 [Aspergillus spinulosporus]
MTRNGRQASASIRTTSSLPLEGSTHCTNFSTRVSSSSLDPSSTSSCLESPAGCDGGRHRATESLRCLLLFTAVYCCFGVVFICRLDFFFFFFPIRNPLTSRRLLCTPKILGNSLYTLSLLLYTMLRGLQRAATTRPAGLDSQRLRLRIFVFITDTRY